MSNVLYLDIETAGDDKLSPELTESLKASVKPDARAKDSEASRQAKWMDMLEDAPLSPLMNRVIAVGYAHCDDSNLDAAQLNRYCIIDESEGRVLGLLSEVVKEYTPTKIITFNGYNFDLPMLRIAFMRHGLQFPIRNVSKYDTNYHIDLRQVLTNYDQYGKGTQSQWCLRLGIPVTNTLITGADIPSLWKDRNFEAIKSKNLDDLSFLISLYKKVRLCL
jgi:DNA polymerase elongation subunit (family B)